MSTFNSSLYHTVLKEQYLFDFFLGEAVASESSKGGNAVLEASYVAPPNTIITYTHAV